MMQRWRDYLKGKKTLGTAAIAVLYLLGCALEWFPYDERVLEMLGFAGLAFLRLGLQPSAAAPTTTPSDPADPKPKKAVNTITAFLIAVATWLRLVRERTRLKNSQAMQEAAARQAEADAVAATNAAIRNRDVDAIRKELAE